MEYFHHPWFDIQEKQEAILEKIEIGKLLDKEQEFHLFRQMNYMKYRATQATPEEKQVWLDRAQSVRTTLVTINMGLANKGARIVSRRLNIHPDELIGDANLSLVLAVDKFNYNRGVKFSTYALWVITRRFSRSKEIVRVKIADSAMLGELLDTREDLSENNEQNQEAVNRILGHLDTRKREVICGLFGLGGVKSDAITIGKRMKISDERVRQLKNRGFAILMDKVSKGELTLEKI